MANRGQLYSVEGDQLVRKNEFCPRCKKGVFMARHADRSSCGRCGWTEWNPGSAPTPVVEAEAPAEEPSEVEAEAPAEEAPVEDSSEEAPAEEPAEVEAEAPAEEAPAEESSEEPAESTAEESADSEQ